MEREYNIESIKKRLLSGISTITKDEVLYMNKLVDIVLNKNSIGEYDKKDIIDIIEISNILYNNIPNIRLPLDDDKYDRLLVLCRRQNIAYPVGALPVKFYDLEDNNSMIDTTENGNKPHLTKIVEIADKKDSMIYWDQLTKNSTPIMREDFEIHEDQTLVSKRNRNVSHNYDMCGTLDKCKYVLVADAEKHGRANDSNVMILERDFFGKHIQQNIIDPNNIHVVVSLKYDGISVEEEIKGNSVVFACTRGDTGNNEASDLTPILGGFKFPRANMISDKDEMGIKFEYIITRQNLLRVMKDYNKTYVNSRNAVIGLLGGLDARKYRDYLTPVPLESSLDVDRITEIKFLNKYFTKGIDMRYIELKGNYINVLYSIQKFLEEASYMRQFLDFQYDGIVVEYVDENLRKFLGKRNNIPRYSIAVKFSPLRRLSTFTHYTFSVGQDGSITPMAHFDPVEFFGAIHDKTTVHSLARFKKLALRSGDKVDLTLNNDVIVYLTKAPDSLQNKNNPNPIEEFPTVCPSCGSQLYESDSGDSATCINFFCPERVVARVTNMLKKLNIKDFSTQTIRLLEIKSFKELMTIDRSYVEKKIGTVMTDKLFDRINTIRETNYPDYRIIGSLGFTSIAAETWRTILENIELSDIITKQDTELRCLSSIKGIGDKIVDTILRERNYFKEDIEYIIQNIPIVSSVQYKGIKEKPRVVFSGFRDKSLSNLFESKGFSCREGGVTKSTSILVVPYIGYQSLNVNKAFKILTNRCNGKAINYSNLKDASDTTPWIMDIEQAYSYLDNYKPID